MYYLSTPSCVCVSMYVCVYMCLFHSTCFVCVCVYMCVHTFNCVCLFVYCMYTMHVFIQHVCVYSCLCMHAVHVFVCMCADILCTCVLVLVCLCICVHVCWASMLTVEHGYFLPLSFFLCCLSTHTCTHAHTHSHTLTHTHTHTHTHIHTHTCLCRCKRNEGKNSQIISHMTRILENEPISVVSKRRLLLELKKEKGVPELDGFHHDISCL